MTLHWTNDIATLYEADARELPLADKSVHMCVTSPPYWGLRQYFDAVAIRPDLDYNKVVEIEAELQRRGIKPIEQK